MKYISRITAGFLMIVSCVATEKTPDVTISNALSGVEKLDGKAQYLQSPYVTAGNRVYMIGHQDGSFPDLGWHIQGEMGGIWDHPIKLMDGFLASINVSDQQYCLDKATSFSNFPMANQHTFLWKQENIACERTQFVPE